MIRRVASALLLLTGAALAQAPADFKVEDAPGDAGGKLLATWRKLKGAGEETIFVVSVAAKREGPWEEVERFPATARFKSDSPKYFGWAGDNDQWHFVELAVTDSDSGVWVKLVVEKGLESVSIEPVQAIARPNLWSGTKTGIFVAVLLFAAITMGFIRRARRNPDLFIRRIPGLDAMEEAIGRATEMGKPIIYLNGLDGMSSISTIAATSILGQVAKRVATYDTRLSVPCFDPVVLSVCQEVMREAYASAGRPDGYREQDAFFVTNDQFSYVAAVDGMMLRERPAACFYFGYYYAESLLLAETGGSVGAIQIAGTDSVTQLPFFIASCDYTLMGEELYAASAYLSREPVQLGSLRAQDLGKLVIISLIFLALIVGLAGETFSALKTEFLSHLFATF